MKPLIFLICFYFATAITAVPLQTVFYNAQSTMLPDEEYDSYSTVVQNYENLVDTVLSSESEIFLIELTHQPRIKLNQALKIQANALGIHNITRK